MNSFEYAIVLLSIVIGLGMTDMGTSLHRLVRCKSVRWDPLALLVALYAFLLLVAMWFDFWAIRNFSDALTFPFYLTLIAEILLLFLFAAAALPDQPADSFDLREFYIANARYFWSLVAIFRLIYTSHWLYFVAPRLPDMALSTALYRVSTVVLDLGLPLLLLALPPRHRAAHFALLSVLLFETMLAYWDKVLS